MSMIDLHDYEPSEQEISNIVWWKDNSPEGATHYLPEQPWVARSFIKEDGDILYYSYGQGYKWAHWGVKRMKSCYKLIERPKECKGMKGSDKVMVELTGYQVAKLYALVGATGCGTLCQSTQLYSQLAKILNSKDYQLFFDKIEFSEDLEVKIYEVLLEPETPVLTEAQKKALEIKETIAKAQKQLEELEKEIA